LQKTGRIEQLMAPGGVADCGKAQNCVEVCPAQIPLVDSIQHMARETTRRLLFGWLLK
jgi:succinate dehydrogenase / fumarate reductase iron-sulfur subunit